ncbi:class I SAM-dependent methyltransferase [Candidatus Bathyarchaeota archaeon]|nr:MAG: class I SAM-dependent methyltransferase [Candidatus Bathyarchaeota archaeon]
MKEKVREWYDTHAEYEWLRLFQDGYHQLEYLVTMHFLQKYLPKTGLVLDAGGGPGRYTIELAKKGYKVVLLDLSPKCLEIAKKEVKKAGVEDMVRAIVEGSITDLSRFGNELFDAVLCLGGPLSHLLERSERERATSELARVAKKKAPLFISVFNRYGVFSVVLSAHPEDLTDSFYKEMFTEGIHRVHTRFGSFPDAYFFLPNELKELLENNGLQTITLASCEGLSAHLEEATNELHGNREKWRRWLKILLQTCTDHSLIGIGNHLLYVGRKESINDL